LEILMNTTLLTSILSGALLISGCGSKSDSNASDTQGDASFKVTFNTHWNGADFPTHYPNGAHWSPLVGTVHNEQVIFWAPDDQPASTGIKSMAETGATSAFNDEIQIAKDAGYSQGRIQAGGIGSGAGSTNIEFSTSSTFPLLTLTSMIAPSPDWFTGIHGVSLQDENGHWIEKQTLNLNLYDAGTDSGLSFRSSDSDNSDQNLSISLLSTNQMDTDFKNGVHFSSGQYIGTLVIEKL
jgi:hypothetical protein